MMSSSLHRVMMMICHERLWQRVLATRVNQFQASSRMVFDSASLASLSGSSINSPSAGRPVPEPPRPRNDSFPPSVVTMWSLAFEPLRSVTPGKTRGYSSELMIARTSSPNSSAKVWLYVPISRCFQGNLPT